MEIDQGKSAYARGLENSCKIESAYPLLETQRLKNCCMLSLTSSVTRKKPVSPCSSKFILVMEAAWMQGRHWPEWGKWFQFFLAPLYIIIDTVTKEYWTVSNKKGTESSTLEEN